MKIVDGIYAVVKLSVLLDCIRKIDRRGFYYLFYIFLCKLADNPSAVVFFIGIKLIQLFVFIADISDCRKSDQRIRDRRKLCTALAQILLYPLVTERSELVVYKSATVELRLKQSRFKAGIKTYALFEEIFSCASYLFGKLRTADYITAVHAVDLYPQRVYVVNRQKALCFLHCGVKRCCKPGTAGTENPC